MSLRDNENRYAKQEGDLSTREVTSSSSRQWSSAFKNPRIVRVSRSFGGKDRHSKVCTIRGLRDRRIRLSVPTAVQLYDLQDRLGLSQPSKVIDWLLDATKQDIDKLPPLQIPGQIGSIDWGLDRPYSQDLNIPQSSFTTFLGPKDVNINETQVDHEEIEASTISEKMKWMMKPNNQGGNQGCSSAQAFGQNLFSLASNSMLPTLPYNYYQWDPSILSLSQYSNLGLPNSHVEQANPHLLFYPSITPPAHVPPPSSFSLINANLDLHSQVNNQGQSNNKGDTNS